MLLDCEQNFTGSVSGAMANTVVSAEHPRSVAGEVCFYSVLFVWSDSFIFTKKSNCQFETAGISLHSKHDVQS
jgi:hypothetical protein